MPIADHLKPYYKLFIGSLDHILKLKKLPQLLVVACEIVSSIYRNVRGRMYLEIPNLIPASH
jgi:hypothetical protein